jgi:23S rRNA (cytosine1962-C5)-methyltransferase
VVYRLGENRLQADLLTDSKTGGFLDQADNHAVVAALAPPEARCLDAFTYHGGFALALARRKGPVFASDEDAQAVARAQANAARNHLPNLEERTSNASTSWSWTRRLWPSAKPATMLPSAPTRNSSCAACA